mgnify:CR=1 FL=1
MKYTLRLFVWILFASLTLVMAQDTTCEAGFRLFAHERLTTDPVCIPENPERVVALDPFAYELLILSGKPPVGAVGYLEPVYSHNFPYLADDIAKIENVGFPPNLESIVALNPDLIVGSYVSDEEMTQLVKIAPTINYEAGGSGDWQGPMLMVAELLGLTDEVEALLAQYQARLDTLKTLVEDPPSTEVSVVRMDTERIMLNLVDSFPATIVADAGFGRPASQAYSAEEAKARYESSVGGFISLEQIELADGDYIFVWSNQASDEEYNIADENWQRVQESPLWQSLGATQNNRAHRVGGHWLGWGIFAAHGVIDDLFTYIAGVDPAEVSPNPFVTGSGN